MKIKEEMADVMKLAGTTQFEDAFENFCKKYEGSEAAKKEIDELIKQGIATSGKRIAQIAIKMQLAEVSDMINLSYIAKHYFKKTRTWLSQRVNANCVNGKPAQFTEEELNTLNLALKDMGKKIGQISVVH